MSNGAFVVPEPRNEPQLMYGPGSPERVALKAALAEMGGQDIEIPLVIGGKNVTTGRFGEARAPHRHAHRLARFHQAGGVEANAAIDAAIAARPGWAAMAFADRAAIFLKAADLLSGPRRQLLNAATMHGQSKTAYQAEIDSACELIDFWRLNATFAEQVYAHQPSSPPGQWNRLEHRELEGFVFAVTPFNFTAIAGNLPTSPAIMGNTVVWKPASTAVLSAHYILKILEEAGLPPGVINLVPGSGRSVGDPVLAHPDLAGIHFTGSTAVFQGMWRTIGENIARYRTYPRIVGETGGKDFVFAHASADPDALATALVRGAFEYQGQKCSAASRAYVPASMWPALWARLEARLAAITLGDPTEDFRHFMSAVIDRKAFHDIQAYIDFAKASPEAEVLFGGGCDDRDGWFIEPTVVRTSNPRFKLMEEEIFGPVLTLFVYDDTAFDDTLRLCDETSPYALTGAIFGRDRQILARMTARLRHAAGNFYINDKPTGAVVGQQPFGGARASGTNDKAGSMLNLQRWVSQRAIKETFVPPARVDYPFMQER